MSIQDISGVTQYGDDYPGDVAGHVPAYSLAGNNDEVVRSVHGYEWGASGSDLAIDDDPERMSGVGSEQINRGIAKRVDDARNRGDRQPIDDSAEHVRFGNTGVMGAAGNVVVARRNEHRRVITVSNQGAGTCFISNQRINYDGSGNTPNNCVYLPAGAARDFRFTGGVYVWVPVSGIIDWIEESYQ
jgi:hypothetical protein